MNSKISPRAFALAGRHPTSDPNPMGNFSRQPPCSMGGPGTPPAAAAQSALLSQQLHAAAAGNSEDAGSGGTHTQRVWSVADMATSLGLERLYQQGEKQAQNDAMYGVADRPHSHSSVAGTVNTANALRGPGGLSQHMSQQAQQAVAHLASQDRTPASAQHRMSMGGEEPSNGGNTAAAQHLQLAPQGPQGAFTTAPSPQSAPVNPTQVGEAGNDPFLQLLQGLKVAKALQGAGESEEPQYQDSHYRALVQMLAQRNAQMPVASPLPDASTCSAGNSAGAVSTSSVPHQPTTAQEAALGSATRSLRSVFDGRLNANVGSQGTIAGLEDMHALASLVAHSTGMPAPQIGGGQAGYAGLVGGLGVDPNHHSVAAGGGDMASTSAPMQVSAAPPPTFNGGHGAAWDVSGKQMQV